MEVCHIKESDEVPFTWMKGTPIMINFDEEVLKFRPCLEIDETEDEIYRNEQKDLQDIIDSVVMSAQNTEYTEQ